MFYLQSITVNKSFFSRLLFLISLANLFCLSACVPSSQYRGMVGSAYVSTASPAFCLDVSNLPLMTATKGSVSLWESGMIGRNTRVWLSVWGKETGPLALVAHAELPEGWYWDGVMSHPFSINEGVEIIGNREWQTFTYIDKGKRSPFVLMVNSSGNKKSDSSSKVEPRWLVRAFTSRHNFDQDKIILEYREKLPAEIESLTAMPYGYANYINSFEERARTIFVVNDVPKQQPQIASAVMPDKVQWRYVDGRFLGSASRKSMDNLR